MNRPIKIELYASVNNAVKIIHYIDTIYRHYPLSDTKEDDYHTWTAESEDKEKLNLVVSRLRDIDHTNYNEGE